MLLGLWSSGISHLCQCSFLGAIWREGWAAFHQFDANSAFLFALRYVLQDRDKGDETKGLAFHRSEERRVGKEC